MPHDVGRIPRKIASGCSGFTAYQWKNWTTILSLFCLKGLIGDKHYDMWSDFVQACIIIFSRVISADRLEVADRYLQTFLSKFVSLYGPLNCTPNMHLHLHLKDCILDYGPVYSFWCFSFERFNGMLGQYHNNCRNIKVQIMRHFQQNKQLYMPLPCEYGTEFINILASKKCDTLSLYVATDMMFLKQNSQISSETLLLEDVASIEPLPQLQDVVLDESDREHLLLMYNKIYPDSCVLQVARLAETCSKVKNLGVTVS